jgi:tetratricopeptide (TPR) repeat protein
MSSLAWAYSAAGRVPDAIRTGEEVLLLQQSRLGAAHPDTLNTARFLAGVYYRDRQFDRYLALLDERVRLSEVKWGREHENTLSYLGELAGGYETLRRPDRAVELLGEAIRRWKVKLGAEGADPVETARRLRPTFLRRARLLAAQNQWEKARADYTDAGTHDADDLEVAFEFAGVLLLAGDDEGYSRLCTRLLGRGDKLVCGGGAGRKSYLLARVCLLGPSCPADPARVVALAGDAVGAQRTAWHLHTLGLALLRAGRHEEAVRSLRESESADPKWAAQPLNGLALAFAHHRLGDPAEARRCHENSVRLTGQKGKQSAPGVTTNPGMNVHDFEAWLLLRREVEAILKGSPGAGRK